jgi:hypothetical protein
MATGNAKELISSGGTEAPPCQVASNILTNLEAA